MGFIIDLFKEMITPEKPPFDVSKYVDAQRMHGVQTADKMLKAGYFDSKREGRPE